MTKRITAEEAATQGFEALLGVFELLKRGRVSEITMASRRKEHDLMAKKVAKGVDQLQDAMWKNGLDCRCARPFLTQKQRRGLDWICTCEPRGKSAKRRKLTAAMMGRSKRKAT